MLAFARRQTLKPEVFEVGRSVQTLAEMIGTLIGSRIEIVILGPEEPCFVNADAGQFETAIINMAVNARDAMEGHGRLTIAVGMAASLPNAAPLSQNPYGYVAVSVADTGSGIPPDQFERIFEPFFTTKQAGHGTGLGLSQVFGFARQSGGEVAVASEVGKGSIFTLYLPRTAGSGKSRQLPADAPAIDGSGMSVLVVEDNTEVGRFTTDALAELGYTTRLVGNATHALEELAVDADRFDVVFTDVVMPGMTGIELAQEIRRRHADLPVVLTSGYSHVLSEHGSYGFELLQKPYSIEQLSRVLHRVRPLAQGEARQRAIRMFPVLQRGNGTARNHLISFALSGHGQIRCKVQTARKRSRREEIRLSRNEIRIVESPPKAATTSNRRRRRSSSPIRKCRRKRPSRRARIIC